MNLLGNSSKRTSSLAIVSVLFFAAIVTATARISFAATSSSGVVIPLYTYPTDGSWAASLQAKKAHPNVPIIAVINPSDGPGGSSDSNYVQGVKNFQAAGIIVIGYVATGYASHGMSDLDAQISRYKNWYSVNGIFFDEMANNQGNENYYSTLNTYVKSLGMTYTMGNPGTTTLKSYVGTLDSIIIYESAGTPSLSYPASATFYPSYSKSNFGFLAYSVPSLDTSFETSTSTYVQWMYITNDGLSNPWDTLPSYFMNEVAALDAGTQSSTSTSTTTSSPITTTTSRTATTTTSTTRTLTSTTSPSTTTATSRTTSPTTTSVTTTSTTTHTVTTGTPNEAATLYRDTFKAIDLFGLPIGGATVKVTAANGTQITKPTDSDGVASFDLPNGSYSADLTYLGVTSSNVDQSSGPHSITVTFILGFPILVVASLFGGTLATVVVGRRWRRNKADSGPATS